MTFRLLAMCSLLFLMSCERDDLVVMGMSPIYYSFDDFSKIKSEVPRNYQNLGKIVTNGNYIYINEINLGIHVIDNTDPTNPKQIRFWNIPGNREFTINDGILYANNGKHLLVLDVTNPESISIVKVIKDQYEYEQLEEYPQNYYGWFQCYEPELGLLLGWEKKEIINPKCKIR